MIKQYATLNGSRALTLGTRKRPVLDADVLYAQVAKFEFVANQPHRDYGDPLPVDTYMRVNNGTPNMLRRWRY